MNFEGELPYKIKKERVALPQSCTDQKVMREGRVVVYLCCGHGLTGFLFAVFDRKIEKVICTGIKKDERFDLALALKEVAP